MMVLALAAKGWYPCGQWIDNIWIVVSANDDSVHARG